MYLATNDPRVNLFDATKAEQEARTLAAKFSAVIREWLSADELKQVRARNKTYGDACATHDFCDANMAMDEAMRAIYGKAYDDDLEDGSFFAEESRFHPLWNRAWTIAKADGFRH